MGGSASLQVICIPRLNEAAGGCYGVVIHRLCLFPLRKVFVASLIGCQHGPLRSDQNPDPWVNHGVMGVEEGCASVVFSRTARLWPVRGTNHRLAMGSGLHSGAPVVTVLSVMMGLRMYVFINRVWHLVASLLNPSWHLTAASRCCCNRRVSWPPSLSLGLGVHSSRNAEDAINRWLFRDVRRLTGTCSSACGSLSLTIRDRRSGRVASACCLGASYFSSAQLPCGR